MSENLRQSRERSPEKIEVSHEHAEKLRNKIEREAQKEKNNNNKAEKLETARNTVEQEAIAKEDLQLPNNEKKHEPVYFTRTDRERSFNATMHHVRSQLTAPSRAFSKVIHQKQIEKASEVIGNTVARPSGILGAAISALIGVSLILFFAKRTGFKLSGSEFWILLCLGYLIGLVIEFIRKLLFKKHKQQS